MKLTRCSCWVRINHLTEGGVQLSSKIGASVPILFLWKFVIIKEKKIRMKDIMDYISNKHNHEIDYPKAWRLVLNKFENRDYAKSMGMNSPKMIWSGDYNEIPWEELPDSYVLKPFAGASSDGVIVVKNKIDISTGKSIDIDEIKRKMVKIATNTKKINGVSDYDRNIFYVTELLGDGFADDYKFYIFNGVVRFIRLNIKETNKTKSFGYFSRNWEPIEGVFKNQKEFNYEEPKCLKEMISFSEKIAKDLNVPFIRVDLYVEDDISVFGELCMTPNGGAGYTEKTIDLFNKYFNEEKDENFDLSIIIPTYNNVDYINQCLDSIIESSENLNIEVLIGIDSCQETLKHVKNSKYPNFLKFYFFDKNVGPYVIKNSLVNISSSENLIFFDSDDIMMKSTLDEIYNNICKYDCVKMRFKNFKNNELYDGKIKFGEGVFSIKKSIFLSMNGFEPWPVAADSDFMGRLYKKRPRIYHTKEVSFKRRIHDNSLTQRKDTGMSSQLRANYAKISKNKKGDGNPNILHTIDFEFIQVENFILPKNFDYKNLVRKSQLNKVLNPVPRKVVDKKMIKKDPVTNDRLETLLQNKPEPIRVIKTNKPQDRQELINKKNNTSNTIKEHFPSKPNRKEGKNFINLSGKFKG